MNKPFSAATAEFHKRAQANADYFGVPYVCFFDSAGQYRIERFNPTCAAHHYGAAIFKPARYDDSHVKMLGE